MLRRTTRWGYLVGIDEDREESIDNAFARAIPSEPISLQSYLF